MPTSSHHRNLRRRQQLQVSDGRLIKREDINGEKQRHRPTRSKVKEELFAGRPALDEYIKVTGLLGSRAFRVVGVMEKKGNIGFTDFDRQPSFPHHCHEKSSMARWSASSCATPSPRIRRTSDEAKIPDQEDHAAKRHRTAPARRTTSKSSPGEFLKQFNQSRTSSPSCSIDRRHLARGRRHRHHEFMLVAVTERRARSRPHWRWAPAAATSCASSSSRPRSSPCSAAVSASCSAGECQGLQQLTRILEVSTTSSAVILALAMATVTG